MQPIPTSPKPRGLFQNSALMSLVCVAAGAGIAFGGWGIAQSATTRGGGGGAMGLTRSFSLSAAGKIMDVGDIERALETKPEFREFLEEVELAMLESDLVYLRDVIDKRAMMERIVERAPRTREAQALADIYRSGTEEAWRRVGVLEHYAGSHYRYLRPRTIDGRTGVLFRVAEDGDLVNYHLHEIVEVGDGYKIADTYIVGLRESLSDALWRGLGHLLADMHPEVSPESDPEGSMAFVESIRKVGDLSHALAKQRFQEAIDIYNNMPEEVQQVRDVMVMRIEAAAKLSPLELDDALAEWKDLGYRETDLPLKFIDYHMARGHYEVARDSALLVSDIVGGEPYLRARIGELNFAIANQVRMQSRGGALRAKRGGEGTLGTSGGGN